MALHPSLNFARAGAPLCLAGLLATSALTAHAQQAPSPAATTAATATEPLPSPWRLQVTPYVWMTGMRANMQVSPQLPTVHVKQSFSDVWDELDAAFFLNATARKDRFVLHGDLSFASLSAQALVPPGLTARAKLRQTALTLAAGYQWLPSANDSVDTMFGLRAWHITTSVQAPPVGSGQIRESWVDPILALRWRHGWSDRWSTLLYADVGGFGAGAHSTSQWMGTVNYQVNNQFYLTAGYRELRVDYRPPGQRLNLRLQGPVLGATWRF